MSFQESFANIASEQFKNGVCRLYVQDYPFTLEAAENNIEIKFPFNKKKSGFIYSLSDKINAFFSDNPSLLDSHSNEQEDINEDIIVVMDSSNQNERQPEKETEASSDQSSPENHSAKARRIIIPQSVSENGETLPDQTPSEMFSHEWDGMFYYISFCCAQNDEAASLCMRLLEYISGFLKDISLQSDMCVFCGEDGAQKGFIVEGALCAAHEQCAAGRLSKRPVSRAIFAYLTAAAFCAVAALTFIPLCRLGIMPSLAGIPMGLLAALGFWLMDRKNAPNRLIMLIIYIVLGSAANFCGDYLYLINSQPQFDFIATFTYSLNIINSIFDVICCVIIAHFSSVIIYDLLYKRLNIRKPEKKQSSAAHANAEHERDSF